jgi:hypothetical protein
MAARRSTLWCGYLEAGEKGSPVVRDNSLDTGNPATVYLFNFIKGRILEYRRDIVDLKLRELGAEELGMVRSLRAAFETARSGFTPRGGVRSAPVPRRRKRTIEVSVEPEDLDFDPNAMPPGDSEPLQLDDSDA